MLSGLQNESTGKHRERGVQTKRPDIKGITIMRSQTTCEQPFTDIVYVLSNTMRVTHRYEIDFGPLAANTAHLCIPFVRLLLLPSELQTPLALPPCLSARQNAASGDEILPPVFRTSRIM